MKHTEGNGYLMPIQYTLKDDSLSLFCENEQIDFIGPVLSASMNSAGNNEISLSAKSLENLIILSGKINCAQTGTITDVSWLAGEWSGVDERCKASTNLSDICLFLRKGNISFFISMDFPYSRITGSAISYDPYDDVNSGHDYIPHTLSIGATRMTGKKAGQYDRAEIEAMSQYINTRYPTRFDRAIFSSACITNRMTDVRDGRIFYSMYDNPTLTLDPKTLMHEIDLCSQLGIEYYQVFEGYFDWEEDGRSEAALDQVMEHARRAGVRVGDYVHPGDLYCPHYNYHHRHLDKPEWRSLSKEGTRGQLCFGCHEFVDYITSHLVSSIQKHKEEMICLDMLSVTPCQDLSHGHPAGGLYRQIRGLVHFMESMNQTSPQFLTWTNSGNWIEFMPKLLWYNPNVYLSDPHPREYSSTLNVLKYLGDCRREQMVSVHNKFFVPYTAYTNCEYYAFRHSRIEDLQYFEYSFLQGLAVTPNICLAELRTFLERIPASKKQYCLDFMKKWMDFTRTNYAIWKTNLQFGDNPGANANEAYAHVVGDRGWICLVNQNHRSNQITFALDSRIGLVSGTRFLLTEEYPMNGPISEQNLPYTEYGSSITLDVPAYSVRIIRIEPYAASKTGVRLYGLDYSRSEPHEGGLTFDLSAECGKTFNAAIVLDDGLTVDTITAQTVKTVPMYTFPTKLDVQTKTGNLARFQITMPRDYFARELTKWQTDDHSSDVLLLPEHSDFLGGYIHNFYKENQHVTLQIETKSNLKTEMTSNIENDMIKNMNTRQDSGNPLNRRCKKYRTTLDIPFIEWPNMSNCYGYDEVIELVFTDHHLVKDIQAFIDGKSCPVCRYTYPVSSAMWTWYIELTGAVKSGTKPELEIDIEWNDAQPVAVVQKNEKQVFVIGQN